MKKLEAFNGEYIRAMSTDEFVERAQPWLVAPHAPWHPEQFDRAAFAAMAPLVQTRVTRMIEVPAMVDFLFLEEPKTDPASWDKAMKGPTPRVRSWPSTIDGLRRRAVGGRVAEGRRSR